MPGRNGLPRGQVLIVSEDGNQDDPNDYDVWQRHTDEIDIINILNPDGTLNENAGPYSGMDRFEAREKKLSLRC